MESLNRRVLLAGTAAAAATTAFELSSASSASAAQTQFRMLSTPRLQSISPVPSGQVTISAGYVGGMTFAADGTPLSPMDGLGMVSHPTRTGNFLLAHMYAYSIDKAPQRLRMVARSLDGLYGRSAKYQGAAFVKYQFPWKAMDGLRNPWYSAFGQSKFPAVAHRMYLATGERKWLQMSREFMNAFDVVPSGRNPFVAGVDSLGALWLEEYPQDTVMSKVFNGHVYAMHELLRYWELSKSPRALEFVKGAAFTAWRWRDRCRVPGSFSRYYHSYPADVPSYHWIHHHCYQLLWDLTGYRAFATTADQMRNDWCIDEAAGRVKVNRGHTHRVRSGNTFATMTLGSTTELASSRRRSFDSPKVWSRMDSGPRAGWYIEENAAAFRVGYTTDNVTMRPVNVYLAPGTHTGYAFSANGMRYARRTLKLSTTRSARSSRTAMLGGRRHWLIDDGDFKGLWVQDSNSSVYV